MSRKQAKSFLQLQAEWDQKLADSGFNDAETRVIPDSAEFGSADRLRVWHSHYFMSRYKPPVFEAKREYFDRACRFLNEYFFEDETLGYFGISDDEKIIWRLHCEGLSARDIAISLHATRYKVDAIVSQLSRRMLVDSA